MADITTRTKVATAIATGMNKIFDNRGKELKPIYPRFLTAQTMEMGQWIDYDMAYFGRHTLKPLLNPFDYDELTFGRTFTVTPDTYSLGYRIARETLNDLADGGYGVDTSKLSSLDTLASKMRDSALQTQEYLSAQVILSANSSTASSIWIGAGRDGAALAATHTLIKPGAGSFSNLMTASAFSYYQVLSALSSIESIPTDEGYLSALPSKVICVVGPYNRARAWELMTAKGKPDTNENNGNYMKDGDFNIEVVVNPHLGSTFKGFAIINPDRAKLYAWERQKPLFEKEMDFNVKGLAVSSEFRFKNSFSTAHGTMFNMGS